MIFKVFMNIEIRIMNYWKWIMNIEKSIMNFEKWTMSIETSFKNIETSEIFFSVQCFFNIRMWFWYSNLYFAKMKWLLKCSLHDQTADILFYPHAKWYITSYYMLIIVQYEFVPWHCGLSLNPHHALPLKFHRSVTKII